MTTNNDHERAMTWAALLGKWTEFAQSAMALPDDDEGGRLKDAVPAIITLQAVTHACAELGQLDPDERSLGADKAEMLLQKNAAEFNRIWSGEVMPEVIVEIVEDAQLALRVATQGGWEWVVVEDAIVTPHPNEVLEAMIASGFTGDLFLPTPGVPIFQAAPAAFVRGVEPDTELGAMVFELIGAFLDGAGEPERVPIARQAYRQFDFSRGGPVRDLVQPMDATLTPGQPLLIPAILAGVVQPISLPIPGTEHQKRLPVEFEA